MLFVNGDQVESILGHLDLLSSLREALIAIADDRVSVPPRSSAVGKYGKVSAMPGWVADTALVVKLVTVFPGNEDTALPSHQALLVVFDLEDGHPMAILDATRITAIRTALVSRIAADCLAGPEAKILAVIGSGVQARAHLAAFSDLRAWSEMRVGARRDAGARAVAAEVPGAVAATDIEGAVRGADVVCLCTSAAEPVVRREWIATGAHIGSVGGGRELDPKIIDDGRLFVEWCGAADYPPPAGAHELQEVAHHRLTRLGELLADRAPGRRAEADLTVYKATGHAAEDAAVARVILDQARTDAVGRTVPW